MLKITKSQKELINFFFQEKIDKISMSQLKRKFPNKTKEINNLIKKGILEKKTESFQGSDSEYYYYPVIHFKSELLIVEFLGN